MDGSMLVNGNARGTVQSSVLPSSPENDSAIPKSPPLSTKGYAVNAQDCAHKNEVKDVRPVVWSSVKSKKALQESKIPDHVNREQSPFDGSGGVVENQNAAIVNDYMSQNEDRSRWAQESKKEKE